MGLIASDNFKIVIGLGETGLACAKFLANKGVSFAVVDSREHPPRIDEFKQALPNVNVRCGPFESAFLKQASELILSPGVSQKDPAIQEAVSAGVLLSGDIDLFCREVKAPVIAITGSNAKSTVTTLVGEMAKAGGLNVGVCGNIGTPVLDMLSQPEKDIYVLELSSFQLETTNDLCADVAAILNVTPDHLDRYDNNIQGYYQAKHRIYRGAKHAVINRDDALTSPLLSTNVVMHSYGLTKPDLKTFGLLEEQGELWLGFGFEKMMPVSELKIRGNHNVTNALASLAIGNAAGLPQPAMIKALKEFTGLKHRCQWVSDKAGVSYFNDSKGTNVGATVAALVGLGETLASDQKLVLIAGGVGKGADFSDLSDPLNAFCRGLVYLGTDGEAIAKVCNGVEKIAAKNMTDAVEKATKYAVKGDVILLSPACASFDMFSGFAARGDAFIDAVEALNV